MLYLWELFVCLIETLLMTYLLYKKIGLKPQGKCRLVPSIIIMTGMLSALSFLGIPVVWRMALMLFLYTTLTLWTFDCAKEGSRYKALLWPFCYLITTATADNITFSIAGALVDFPLEELMRYNSARIQFTLIYLLLIALTVWTLAHLNEPDTDFPVLVSFTLFVLVGVGIFAAESILDIALVLGIEPATSHEAKTLTVLSYSILVMLVALLITFEWLGVILRKNRELQRINQLSHLEQAQYQLVVSASESMAKWKHDYQGQLRLIAALVEQGNYSELKQFTGDLASELRASAFIPHSGNCVLDTVVSLRMAEAERENIHVQTKLFLPDRIPLDDVAFASLVGNLLDNAIEACRKVPPARADICFEIKPWNQMMYLYCANTSDGTYQRGKNGDLQTNKQANGHGIGIHRIREIVEQTGGTCQFVPEESRFSVSIMIPLEERDHENCNCGRSGTACGISSGPPAAMVPETSDHA